MTPTDPIALAGWRRTISETYAAIRRLAPTQPERAWQMFRDTRDMLFRTHSQTPLAPAHSPGFAGLRYFPYNPAWRLTGTLRRDVERATLSLDLPGDGRFQYTRVVQAVFVAEGQTARLSLFWIEGYGGGLFLPFTDVTGSQETYGGGRYLFDTIKGADLGLTESAIVLDFNYAYNPSCAYDARWVCPLSPPENRLPFRVTAGELGWES